MSTGAEIGALLAQTAWIRALARSLVADVELAEDLVQDAWVAALERPPRADRSVRGWLATVLRNRSSDLGRERGGRARREQAAARDEALPSAHDVVEKAALQRALVGAVLELDEPFRTTVLLRFFEDLPQREIARRMQTTTATVNSRLTRALEKLRDRLARGGGRGAWLQALLPLLGEPTVAPVALLGIPVMKLTTAAVVTASVLVGVVLWRSTSGETRAERSVPELATSTPPRAPGERTASALIPEPAAEPEQARSAGERTVVPAPASPAASVPAREDSTARIVRGRVLDAFGHGLAGIALRLDAGVPGSDSRCTSAAGGWFEIGVRGSAETVLAADPRYATVLAGMARVLGETQALVVVAPRIELAGRVLDESGAPVVGATVELELPADFGAEWGLALDYSLAQAWTAASGADGRFALAAAPALDEAALQATLGGYESHSEPAPLHSDQALVIVLTRPPACDHLVHGVVLDPAGTPVEGARVAARGESTLTRSDGAFALDLSQSDVRPPLIAVKHGFQPALFEPERDERGAPRWPASIVLRLGGSPGSLHGRVVDADGRAVSGAKVWLVDPTPFGQMGQYLMAAESLARGDERFWSFAVTDTDGRFSIDGLLERAYRVQALAPETLVSVESAPLRAADSPVELVLPTNDVHDLVAGRIVSRGGRPVPGALVRLFRKTFEVQLAEGRQNDAQEGESRITDPDGAFEFTAVPKEGVHLLVTGDTLLFAGTDLMREDDVTDIEIAVSVRLHLQVELDAPHDRADSLRVLDAAGNQLTLNRMAGEGAHFGPRMPILDGRSAVISLDEDAATLVLERGAEEVARMPLHLVPGAPNVVRY